MKRSIQFLVYEGGAADYAANQDLRESLAEFTDSQVGEGECLFNKGRLGSFLDEKTRDFRSRVTS